MAQQLIFSLAESDNQGLIPFELASLPTIGIAERYVLDALDENYKKKTCNWPGSQNTN